MVGRGRMARARTKGCLPGAEWPPANAARPGVKAQTNATKYTTRIEDRRAPRKPSTTVRHPPRAALRAGTADPGIETEAAAAVPIAAGRRTISPASNVSFLCGGLWYINLRPAEQSHSNTHIGATSGNGKRTNVKLVNYCNTTASRRQTTNAKLRQRQLAILGEVSGASEEACRDELARSGGDLRLALLSLLSGLESKAAAGALADAGGSVREALAGLGFPGPA